MKAYIFSRLKKLIDWPLSIVVIPAAYLLWFYRRAGSGRLPKTTERLKKIGVFPIRNHYYEPLFDDRLLAYPLDKDRQLPGIDFNVQFQLALLEKLTFSKELVSLNLGKPGDRIDSFYIGNDSFGSGDAEFLYQIIRYLKPRKIIEIGSGNSTKIARLALKQNKIETDSDYEHICVEPYEMPWLDSIEDITIVRERIENYKLDWANKLSSGDLLFVDSSHMIRPQGDVLQEYLEIFPRLKSGVYVHVHDIFTPKDYPTFWVVDEIRFWNEQYLLEALLTNTNHYEVVAALNFLKHNHYNKLSQVCPYLSKEREPGSFYFKVS